MKARKTFLKLIERMEELPTLPSSISKIFQVLDDPNSSAKDVSQVISQDQSLVVRVLKIVNSPFYGFPRRIESIDHAVVLLGYRPLRDMILVTSLFREANIKGDKRSLDRVRFWRHAVGVGVAAQTIAQHIGARQENSAFIAGLLHDIGKVFLDAFLHQEYIEVVSLARQKNLLLYEAEEEVLGANHTDFGHWLADAWNLPLNLTDSVAYHHQPSQSKEHYNLTCLVHMGDILTRALEVGDGGDNTIPAIDRHAWAFLNLTPELFKGIITEFDENLVGTDFLID